MTPTQPLHADLGVGEARRECPPKHPCDPISHRIAKRTSQTSYVVLQHKRHLFGIRTTPIMVFTDLVRARMEADLLKGSLPTTTFSVILAPLVQ